MKKDLLCVHEYRTPVCKVVRVHVEGLICDSFGTNGAAGGTLGIVNEDGDENEAY